MPHLLAEEVFQRLGDVMLQEGVHCLEDGEGPDIKIVMGISELVGVIAVIVLGAAFQPHWCVA